MAATLMAPTQASVIRLNPYTPRLPPYRNVIQERCNKYKNSSFTFGNNFHAMPKLSISISPRKNHQQLHSDFPRGLPTSHSSSSVFLGENQSGLSGNIRVLPNQCRCSTKVRAQERTPGGLYYPELKEKPVWWWRTLASIPYLVSLQISDTGFFMQPFLEHHEYLEDLIFYIPGAAKRWSSWFIIAYVMFLYMGVVQNEDWPHFFRYHLMTAMLLETALQVLIHSSNFMPLIHFNGALGMYYWAAVGFMYIFILLEGIRCALGGKHVKIPFISEAALIHTKFRGGGYYRPF